MYIPYVCMYANYMCSLNVAPAQTFINHSLGSKNQFMLRATLPVCMYVCLCYYIMNSVY